MDVVSSENAEHYAFGEACEGWHLLKSHGLTINQERMPPGSAEATHYHERAQQFFFVLEGEAVMEVRGQRFVISPEHGLCVPPGVPHRLLNDSVCDVVFLVISAPLGAESIFSRFGGGFRC